MIPKRESVHSAIIFVPVNPILICRKKKRILLRKENKKICSLLQEISGPIRIYLFGNDEFMSDEWSTLMFNNEQFNFNDNGPQYGHSFTFAQYESVTRRTIERLNSYGGKLGRITLSMLKRLDKIEEDPIYFVFALQHVHDKFKEREMAANLMLSQWTMNYRDSCTDHSDRVTKNKSL